jgi:hypothetical protein
MVTAIITSYDAIVARRASDGNAGMDVRYIYLAGKNQEIGGNLNFTISFYEAETGDMGNYSTGSGVEMGLPLREYADMYHILQTESRIFARFEIDENNKVIWFQWARRITGLERNPQISRDSWFDSR